MSPTASIQVALLIRFANSISISVASGTSGSNPLSSSGESIANLTFPTRPPVFRRAAATVRNILDFPRKVQPPAEIITLEKAHPVVPG
jgi:hypothetical protein